MVFVTLCIFINKWLNKAQRAARAVHVVLLKMLEIYLGSRQGVHTEKVNMPVRAICRWSKNDEAVVYLRLCQFHVIFISKQTSMN